MGTVEQLSGGTWTASPKCNLDGFYELAKVFGGVEVCLHHAVDEPGSPGPNFPQGTGAWMRRAALAFRPSAGRPAQR